MPADFYRTFLYPLQDRALGAFRGSPFYLTGGTALSRGYFQHRYSDDLDLFVNNHPDFAREAERRIGELRSVFPDLQVTLQERAYWRLLVSQGTLKIELVNDVPAHAGTITEDPVLGRLDSRENILANKISALVDRALPKDVADLYVLLKGALSFKQALTDASSKAAGISPLLVAKILTEFDYTLLDTEIKWIVPVPGDEVAALLRELAEKIVHGEGV